MNKEFSQIIKEIFGSCWNFWTLEFYRMAANFDILQALPYEINEMILEELSVK